MPVVDLTIIVPIAGLAAIAAAAYLSWRVLQLPEGDEMMRRIASRIQEGARAFMRRQYTTIAVIALVVAVIFAGAIGVFRGLEEGMRTAIAFGLGATASAASGYIGMHIAIRANSRTANDGLTSFGRALKTALRGGAVSGLTIIGFSLLGVWGIYEIYNLWFGGPTAAEQQSVILSIVGFGFGASLVALFAQLGGGIFTKAADVGADLVGKIEGASRRTMRGIPPSPSCSG